MPSVKIQAFAILAAFPKAESELLGNAVILTDGKAGTIDGIWLDELHGLRISIKGHEGKWPESTIKLAQAKRAAASPEDSSPACSSWLYGYQVRTRSITAV